MSFFNHKYDDFVNSKEESRSQLGSLKDFIDGSVLTSSGFYKLRPLLIMLFIFAMFYIYIRNKTEEAYKYKNNLESDVRNYKDESTSVAAGLMFMSKESEVIKRIKKEGINLIESTEPPIIIYQKED